MNERNSKSTKAPLLPAMAKELRALIAKDGEKTTAILFGISEPTLGRAAGGMGVEAGTRALIELRLARLANGPRLDKEPTP